MKRFTKDDLVGILLGSAIVIGATAFTKPTKVSYSVPRQITPPENKAIKPKINPLLCQTEINNSLILNIEYTPSNERQYYS